MMDVDGYNALADVLRRAYDQAARGKGKERHAQDLPFTQQPMQTISQLIGSHDGLLYQAMKKIQESQRLEHDAAIRELLGAIVYIGGAIIYREMKQHPQELSLRQARPDAFIQPDMTRITIPEGTMVLNHGIPVPSHWSCKCRSPGSEAIQVPIGEACPRCHAIA